MLWICLLSGGALLGFLLSYDEWQGILMGAACGWMIGAGIRLYSLRKRSVEQQQQLDTTRKTLESLQQRIAHLEFPPASDLKPAEPEQAPAPLPPDAVVVAAQTEGPELIWDLPDAPAAPAPADESPWRAAPAPTTRKPATANVVDTAVARAKEWLLGGNTVLRVGVVLLFLGLAFLLRYATEGMVFPLEARYAAVAACASGLLGLGWWLRHRNTQYALMMQGAGIGVLYLTVFAAMKLHPLLDPSMGFTLLVAVTAFSAILAVTQNALALACAGALGGFAAPLLASTGQGSHVALFSYFALLNAGILSIAWFKAWRVLNLIGFFGTFGIGFAWGIKSYTPAMFWTTEPFLILFFAMYLAIGLMFARRKLQEADGASGRSPTGLRRGEYVDGTVLFGTPIVGFGLQYALVEHLEFGAAFSALALGAIYMGLARLLTWRASEQATLLIETCLALGVVFATLAIPLGLGSQWTTCAWAVEGAAVFWLGMRQGRALARGFGLLLQIGAGAALFSQLDLSYASLLANGDYWTPMVMAIAALTSAWCVHRFQGLTLLDPKLATALLIVWGAAWWAFSLACSVLLFVPDALQPTLLLIAAAASVGIWAAAARRLHWPDLAVLCTALTPVAGMLLIGSLRFDYHPAQHWAWLGWLAVVAVHFVSLRQLAPLLPSIANSLAHVLGCWLLIALLALELRFGLMQLSERHNAWRWLGWALLPSLYLLAMAHPRRWPWPVSAQARDYRVWAAAPMAVLMLGWFWLANVFSDGAAAPLPYVPVLNPLELGLLFALAGVVLWMQRYLSQLGVPEAKAQRNALLVAGASLFAMVTATVMRTAHHWSDIPWATDSLLSSMLVQASLSIVWTLMALALMIGGHLRRKREIWIAGAALIGVVVAKLFFIELSDRGSMARIVSFIGVGMLLLVVGYFAPLPPKNSDKEACEEPDLPPAAESRQP